MITLAQKKTYEFIKDFFKNQGHAPTIAEIAKGIGIKSRGVAHRYVRALADNGLLKLIPDCRRNIELIQEEPEYPLLPLVGRIAAGQPIEAVPQHEALDIMNIFLGANRFALQVKGDSMIEEGIMDGDLVVCEHCGSAKNGQIVVALIDNQEATLKKIQYNQDHSVTLIPANMNLQPMVYPAKRVQIQGIFIGLMRFSTKH